MPTNNNYSMDLNKGPVNSTMYIVNEQPAAIRETMVDLLLLGELGHHG